MKRTPLLLLGLALGGGVFCIDRWTKSLFMGRETRQIFGNFFGTTSHQNFGLIANVPVPHILILLLTIGIICVIGYASARSIQKIETTRVFSYSLILGGALGNLYDRLTLGYVFDWLLFFQRSILNLADIFIGLGIVIFILHIRKPN